MKILQINITYGSGSTGKIVKDLQDEIEKTGNECFVLCGTATNIPEKYSDKIYCISHDKYFFHRQIFISRVSGRTGYNCTFQTRKAIKWIKSINPDIVHLHNIHSNFINVKLIFDYLKESNVKVVWTLHDCWSFTGRCSHFESIHCDKWKDGCHDCKLLNVYPISYLFDFSKSMYADKKKWFIGLHDVTLVTPSEWLKKYVDQSFLNCYKCHVIHNGINTELFKTVKDSKIIDTDKKIILGVASSWEKSKGFYDFIKLDSMIDHDKYQIVMVGLNDRQMNQIPKSIFGIKRTNNQQELVSIYNQAYVFLNLTYLDNYPTTNLEAQCCGTPIITYRTGGSPESALNQSLIVEQGNVEHVVELLSNNSCNDLTGSKLNELATQLFSQCIFGAKYLDLYLK